MGAIAVFMIIFFMTDPPRGKADGSHLKPTSPVSDVRALGRNKSFVLSTIAFTCVTYCAGAMMWWGPNFAYAGFNKNSYSILSRLLSSSFSLILPSLYLIFLYVSPSSRLFSTTSYLYLLSRLSYFYFYIPIPLYSIGSDPFVLYPVRSFLTLTFNTAIPANSFDTPILLFITPTLSYFYFYTPIPSYSDPFVQLLIVWSLPTLTFIISCELLRLIILFGPSTLRPFPTLIPSFSHF